MQEVEEPGKERPRRRVKREFWVILAILGVFLSGVPAIFALPTSATVFNPQAYKQALAEQGAYERFPEILGEMIERGGNTFLFGSGGAASGSEQLLETLQRSNYEAAVRQIFPEEWVRSQAESLIDQFWAYFNFQSPSLRLLVDLRPVKAGLNSEDSGAIAETIINGLPGCTGEEILNYALQALRGELSGLPLCRPPQELAGLANLLVQGMLQGSAAAMPDQVDLATIARFPAALGGERLSTTQARTFTAYHFFRQAAPWLPVLSALLLGLTAYLSWETTRGPLFWTGLAALLTGAVAALIALLLMLWFAQAEPAAVRAAIGENTALLDVLIGMLGSVVGQHSRSVLWIALGVAVLGGAAVGIAFWRGRALPESKH